MKTHLGIQKFGSIIKLPLGTIGIGMVRPNTPSVLTPHKTEDGLGLTCNSNQFR